MTSAVRGPRARGWRLAPVIAAFAAVVALGLVSQAPAATGVSLGETFAFIEADPNAPDPVEDAESDSLPFTSGVSSGGATADQSTTFTDTGTGITLDSTHSLSTSGGDPDIATSVLEQQFTVTAAELPIEISGSLSDSLSGGQTEDQTVVFREVGGGELFAFNDADDPTFSGFGDLSPGTYELEVFGECFSDESTGACTADLDVTLELGEADCAANVPKVGFALPQGCFTETDSGVFETTERAWVGGFEILPRSGGKLVVDTGAKELSAAGAGADVVFAGFRVPIPIAAIPVGQQDATFELGQPGTVFGLLDLPVESTVKVSWAGDGKSAVYEQEVKVEKLTEEIGEIVTLSPGESVGETAGKLKATLKNGEGFVLEQGEVSVNEVNVIPKKLRIPRKLKLKNLLLKFERRANKPFWIGQAGIGLPLARGDLDLTGKAFVFDGDFAGAGFDVDGINKRVLGPFFLQKAGGDAAFVPIASPPEGVIAAPEFGYDVRVGGTLGPRIEDKELVSLDGQMQGGSLVSDCEENANRPDPTKLQAQAKLAPMKELEDANLAKVDITQRACIYPGTGAAAAAIEGTLEGEISFLDGALGYKGTQTGFVSSAGASYEGVVVLRLAGLPDLDGSAIVSTVGVAACADFTFFEGGFGHKWGGPPASAFAGCDLGEFRLLQAPSRFAGAAAPRGLASSLQVPRGLPHAGFAATGTTGPPAVTVSGPGGASITSPADGSALRTASAAVVPVAHENTTYVFVRRPKAGSWRVDGADPANPVTEVRFAEGLAEARVKGKVSKPKRSARSKRFRLRYSARRIEGQKVTLFERGEGIARKLGRTRGGRGSIAFKPTLALDRKRTIEAEVVQDGLPRELITVAKFKAPKLPKIAKPKLRAKRQKNSVTASWRKVRGASEYVAELTAGSETLYRVLTEKRRLRFAGTPKQGKLKLSVQALSEVQPPGPPAKLKLKRKRRR